MRLAAKMTPMRSAERRSARLRATLRETPAVPRDIDIIDISDTGFLAELPDAVTIEPGTSIRVAATPIGNHVAIAVRHEGRRHGFVFVRPLAHGTLARIDTESAGNVVAFAGGTAFAAAEMELPRLSARSSLAIISGVSLGLWTLLGGLLFATAQFA